MGRLRSLSRGGRVLVALVVGGSLFGIVSAVQASIPDSGGVIHGCYYTPSGKIYGPGTKDSRQIGDIRVIDSEKGQHCASTETALNWSQTGPTGASGPSGPSGASGPSGPSGPAGPSNAYTNYQSFNNVALAGGSSATMASVSLPAGSYTLSGAARYFGTDTLSVVGCQYSTSGGTSSLHQLPNGSVLDVTSGSESPVFATIPVVGDITVTSGPTTVNLVCDNSNGSDTADIQSGAIVAIKVATITAQ